MRTIAPTVLTIASACASLGLAQTGTPAKARPAEAATIQASGTPAAAVVPPMTEVIRVTEIRGVVLTPDGKKAANARVGLLVDARPGEAGAPPRLATTDESGAFALEVGGVRAFGLQAFLPPYALAAQPRLRGGMRVTLKLQAGGRLGGTVLDALSGKPLANAVVEASEWDVSPFAEADPAFGVVRASTDAKGRFNLTGLAASGRLVARARLRGYATGTATSIPPSGLVFRLEPGHDLAGMVADSTDRPIAKANILLRPTLRRGSDGLALQSNASGRFQAVGLRNVAYDATVTAPGFAPLLQDAIPADAPSLTVKLERSSRLTGRFVDEEDKPLRGIARVRSWRDGTVPSDIERLVTVETGREGRFILSGLKTGLNVIDLRAQGFPRLEHKVEIARPGETVEIGDVKFERGLSIRGRVSEGEDRPVSGARIQATRAARTPTVEPFFTETGDDGRFELLGLQEEAYQLSISADGFARRSVKASPSDETVPILLRRLVSLSGRLVDGEGQPVERARVSAQKGSDQAGAANALSTADGRFTLDLGDTGEIQLSATAEGFKPLIQTLQVEAQQDLGDLVLARGLRLRGVVVDARGAAVTGARVENQTTRQMPVTFAETDDKGRFELTGAASGRVRLVATHWQYSPGQTFVEVKEGDEPEEAKIVLGSGARIEGFVRQRDGTPIGQALVHLLSTRSNADLRPPSSLQMALTLADGSFVFEHLVPGPANVVLMTGPGAQPGSYTNVDQAAVSLLEGETTTVNLTLRTTTVRGTVRRRAGSAAGLVISMRSTALVMMSGGSNRVSSLVGDIPWHSAEADAEGRFALRIVGPVKAWLAVSSADRQTVLTSKEIDIPDLDEYQLPVDVLGARMSGRVVDAEGKAIGDAPTAVVRSPGSGMARNTGSWLGRTNSAGEFVFELEPGEYQVSAGAEGYAGSSPRKVTMTTSDLSVDDIALSRGGSISGRATLAGQPVAQARVDSASTDSPSIQSRYTGPDGYFTVTGLSDEATRLTVSDDAGHVGVQMVPPGSTDPVEIRLGPAARVVVSVLASKDQRANAIVLISKVDGYPSTGVSRVDPDGCATLFVPPGAVTVRASSGSLVGEATVQTTAGETANVSIELKPGPPSKD